MSTAQDLKLPLVQALSKAITHATPGLAVSPGFKLGTLPAGCTVLRTSTNIPSEAFTAHNLEIGKSTDTDAFQTAANIDADATGYKTTAAGNGTVIDADTDVYAFYSGGTAPAAGEARIFVEFVTHQSTDASA